MNYHENEFIAIGETMASFTPVSVAPLRYVKDYTLHLAGTESNVAIGVAKLGHKSMWVSKLGNDEFGHYIYNTIRGEGVNIDYVKFEDDKRTGVMFKEIHASSETKVFYYRDNSAACYMNCDDVDEETIAKAKILYLTGITPLLSDSCKELIEYVIGIAKRHNVLLSFDPNIRQKLWGKNDYRDYMLKLSDMADILLIGDNELEFLSGETNHDKILDRFLESHTEKKIAIKKGGKGALVADKNERISVEPFICKSIDPIGAGDGFNAGFLTGILENKSLSICAKMGAVIGAKATETYGDFEGYPDKNTLKAILSGEEEVYR